MLSNIQVAQLTALITSITALIAVIVWSNVIVGKAKKSREELIKNLTFAYTREQVYTTYSAPHIQLKVWIFVWKDGKSGDLYVSLNAYDSAGNDATPVDAYTVAITAIKPGLHPCGSILPNEDWAELIDIGTPDI